MFTVKPTCCMGCLDRDNCNDDDDNNNYMYLLD